jgi:glycosyltransferase involved in cell wall biosynthesis
MSEDSKSTITAVIPAFNEEKTIAHTVLESKKYVNEVVVVDDGSLDDTCGAATRAGATVLRHPVNLGYGAALATGFEYMRNNGAQYLVVLDGDGQHSPADIPKLVEPLIRGNADITNGSRFINEESRRKIPAYRKIGIGMVNKAWNLSTKNADLTDTQCGFRAYTRDAVNKIDITQTGMCASLEILDEASQNKLRIIEVPVSAEYGGTTSTVQPGRHGMELINYVLKKMKEEHPLLIFGGSGVVVSTIGLAFGIYSMNSYFESRYLPFGPTIVAGIMIYVGTLLVFGGLILNSIQALAAKFEERNSRQ